jgi:hypothetical protein
LEVTSEVKLNNSYHNSFIPNQEVAEGVMVQRTISSKSNSLVTFINTNLHDVTIQNLTLKSENVYTVYTTHQQVKQTFSLIFCY